MLLERRHDDGMREYALWSLTDWVEDAGAVVCDFSRRSAAVDRLCGRPHQGDEPVPRTAGCWRVRATRRNRTPIGDHRHFFRARFPGRGRAWLAALTSPGRPVPTQPALLWVSVKGERIFPARLG